MAAKGRLFCELTYNFVYFPIPMRGMFLYLRVDEKGSSVTNHGEESQGHQEVLDPGQAPLGPRVGHLGKQQS